MDQLAAPPAEGGQVRVSGVDGLRQGLAAHIALSDPGDVAVEVEGRGIVAGVLSASQTCVWNGGDSFGPTRQD